MLATRRNNLLVGALLAIVPGSLAWGLQDLDRVRQIVRKIRVSAGHADERGDQDGDQDEGSAQSGKVANEEDEWNDEEWGDAEEAKGRGPARRQGRANLVRQVNIEQQLFRGHTAQSFLDGKLDERLTEVDLVCNLSDQQRDKLRLGGRGDVARFLARYRAIRAQIETNAGQGQKAFRDAWQQVGPLQQEIQTGVFRDGSLFGKVLEQILTSEQTGEYQREQRELAEFAFRANVRFVVCELDRRRPMTVEQRRRLRELLYERTRPPRAVSGSNSRFLPQYILWQMAQSPSELWEDLFDEGDWAAMRTMLDEARRWESMVTANGLIPVETPRDENTNGHDVARE